MTETGQVIALDGKLATVRFERTSACAKCGKCMMSESQKEMRLTIKNTLQANVGDWVSVDMASTSLYRASFVAYGIPTIALVLGLVGGYFLNEQVRWLAESELLACIGGVLLLSLAFAAIRLCEPRRKASGKYTPRMLELCAPPQTKD